GRLILLSTPFGRRGFFYQACADHAADWLRFEVRAEQIPRISRAFLDEELRTLGRSWFNQEYTCSFEAVEGLVYPEFAQCVVREVPAELRLEERGSGIAKGRLDSQASVVDPPASNSRLVGGLDFGFRNPFAAVWGALD